MNTRSVLLAMLLLSTYSCAIKEDPEVFSSIEHPRIELHIEGNDQFIIWEIDNKASLWEFDLGEVKGIDTYRDSLIMKIGEERLMAAVQKESTQDMDHGSISEESDGDKINAHLVHSGESGLLRKINCLEAQLLNYQLMRYPLFSHPTEFHGFIGFNAELDKYRVYFAASDTEWPPKPRLLLDEIDKDLERGWQLKYHLHNHYSDASGDYIGILAPSMADAQYFKFLAEDYAIEKAFITNGFHTVVIEASEFNDFRSH